MKRRPGPSLVTRVRIEAHAVWLAARDPRTPLYARLLGLAVAAYAFSPIDLVPDFIPVLGLLDDAILVPLGVWLFLKLLPPGIIEEHRAAATAAADRPRSAAGMLIVLGLWIALALLAWALLTWTYA
ncbi:MAG TPA: YkvA family protein [Allosphingosinicella sp.]|nr:YkvA family protein [Allosphingosinicella sp.]